MAEITGDSPQARRWRRRLARGVAFLWASGWLYVGVTSGADEGAPWPGILLYNALPGLVFLVSAIVAWRWEIIGGTALFIEGWFVIFGSPIAASHGLPLLARSSVLLALTVPPLTAGFLFISDGRSTKKPDQI